MSLPSPSQIRAARALLGWSQEHLGELSGVSVNTLSRLESGKHPARDRTVKDIARVLEESGITFTGGEGVRGVSLHLDPSE